MTPSIPVEINGNSIGKTLTFLKSHGRVTNDRVSRRTVARDMREQFARLADEEKNEMAPGFDPYIYLLENSLRLEF
jgi:hypothetical protein